MKVNPKPADVTTLRADRPPVEKTVGRAEDARVYSRHELVARVWRWGAITAASGFLAGLVTMFVVVSAFGQAEAKRTVSTFSQGVAVGKAVAGP